MGNSETKEERAARLKKEFESNKRTAICKFWEEAYNCFGFASRCEVFRQDKTIVLKCISIYADTSECARYGVELEQRDIEFIHNGYVTKLIFVDKVPIFYLIWEFYLKIFSLYRSEILQLRREIVKEVRNANKKAQPDPLPAIQDSTGLECPVCFAPNAKFVNVQCGHVCCCVSCLNAIRRHGKCPKCRTKLSQTIKIYI